ncbi:protein takeout-like [Scaptodrosophila lebanonensis]|uniref:Protein takeout-like n=1 Tax=Drosophila lebanonensis TaxID=7225 RepID=A0A6J2T5K9_DROLE|nr:protein takeout-like [Scaptodrosophila lebanonensis]
MRIKISISLSLLALSVVLAVAAANYLTEKPDYLNPCRLDDSGFQKCLAANLQVLFSKWKDGLPGTNTLTTIDPLHIKRIKISPSNGAIVFNAELRNVQIKGASRAVVQSASYDPSSHTAKTATNAPKLRFEFDYKVKGHILALNLNSQGKGYFEADDATLNSEMFVKPRITPEAAFADVQGVNTNLKIGGFKIRLENLFGGNKDLEDTAHVLFNENWRDFFELMRPTIEQTVDIVLLGRFKKTFEYVPANYFIENFH